MREDIVGMLKNAISHGGNPSKIAQSLINSGYELKDVKEALDYVSNLNLNSTFQPPIKNPIPQDRKPPISQDVRHQNSLPPVYNSPPPVYNPPITPLKSLKPLPSQKSSPHGKGKIIAMVFILILLVLSLLSVILFKDSLLDLLSS